MRPNVESLALAASACLLLAAGQTLSAGVCAVAACICHWSGKIQRWRRS